MFRTSNPFLKEKAFNRKAYLTGADPNAMMTLEGTINKTLILFAILVVSALAGAIVATRIPTLTFPTLLVGALTAFVLALVVSFKPETSPVLGPAYAVFKGLAVGVLSMMYEAGMMSNAPVNPGGTAIERTIQSGIVLQAIGLTFAVFGLMLLLYRARILRATPTFTRVVVLATGGIFIFYCVAIVARLGFGYMAFPFIHEGTPLGIVFSLGVVALAAMNFVLDFDLIERGSNTGAPKFMEWYAGFALLVTVVWLYLEMLRLLNKLRR